MNHERIAILSALLDASDEDLVRFLDEDLEADSDQRPPPLDFFVGRYVYVKGTESAPFRKPEHEPSAGTVILTTRWHKDKWMTYGTRYENSIWGQHEFYGGHVELSRADPSVERPIVTRVVSVWPSLRPYWEWVAKRLVSQFKMLESVSPRRGGPSKTPLDKRYVIVVGWREAIGKRVQQVDYCAQHGITERTLQLWEVELEEMGMISKRAR